MSGFSSHGVACAKAEVESAVSAAAIKKVLVEIPVIVILLLCRGRHLLNKSRTMLFRQYDLCSHRITPCLRVCDFPPATSRLCSRFRLQKLYCLKPHRDDSDEPRHEILFRCRIVVHGAGPGGGGSRRLQAG